MAYVLIAPPAVEPVTVAEVMANSRIDEGSVEPAPGAPLCALASPATAGNVDNGAHRYLVTFVTATGETQAGVPSAPVSVADKTISGQIAVTGIPLGGGAVIARKIHRTIANGSAYLYHSTLPDNSTTSFIDNLADASLGAGAPVANTTGDPLLSMYIASARAAAELETQRQLITATWKLVLDAFPGMGVTGLSQGSRRAFPSNAILLHKSPVKAVTQIRYLDMSGQWQVMNPSDYVLDANTEPARITPPFGRVWPIALPQIGAVEVTFTAGYGAAADVPPGIKHWILLRVDGMFKNRGETTEAQGELVKLPFTDGLLDPYRVGGSLY